MDLLWGEVISYLTHCPDDLVDEGLAFARLQRYKMPSALVSDFDESIARHVLDTFPIISINWLVNNL